MKKVILALLILTILLVSGCSGRRRAGDFSREDWEDREGMRGEMPEFDESQINDISELFTGNFTQWDIGAYCRVHGSDCDSYCNDNPDIENCQFYQNMKERRPKNEENI